MASNRDRIGAALDALAAGLRPYVDRALASSTNGRKWWDVLGEREGKRYSPDDPQALLVAVNAFWPVFSKTLSPGHRSYANEARDVRNKWAHHESISSDDAVRGLDTIERLLTAVSAADQAAQVRRLKYEVQREQYDREARRESAKAATAPVESGVAGLKPWREVAIPHADVRAGNFVQAEFAADLWQVHHGEGSREYVDPIEFFRRTFLTGGLADLLTQAALRLSESGGTPVVDLQTNFGGGKTHSMLALYHLFCGRPLTDFPDDVRELLAKAGVNELPPVSRAVLVGTAISPGVPRVKDDGTKVNTLWGELAWQLGGRAAYEMVAEADASKKNPGDQLKELLARYAPVLVLVDEWVAYARQLSDDETVPGGTFETQFTFAQALTEQVKAVPGALLVVSIPASDRGDVSDLEVGGVRGREALARLRHVVHRVDAPWRPANADESFAIVRRRLFEPLAGPDAYRARNATARHFVDFYRRDGSAEFPSECKDSAYEAKLVAAYPIHPELFARLYEDWSTLEKFQRTRGVLRLMAKVVASLWAAGDATPLILPGSLPLADPQVEGELTRILDEAWKPVIDADVDGPGSLPAQLDATNTRFGQRQATRRVARTLFLGSAPTSGSANRGLPEQRVKLGTVLPGESPAVFTDALRRLAQQATYLYADGERYWYSLTPSVNRKAQDEAERLKGSQDVVHVELVSRLEAAIDVRGTCFTGKHIAPASSAEVLDEARCRVVALPPHAAHVRARTSDAVEYAAELLRSRGGAGRSYRNMLVFLAADAGRLPDLEAAVRELLAWQRVRQGEDELDGFQRRQVADRCAAAEQTVGLRLAEVYQWLLVPSAEPGSADVRWEALRFDGRDAIAKRAAEKLLQADLVRVEMAPVFVGMDLRGVLAPLWESGHVTLGKLWEHYATYLYLARMRDIGVLQECVRRGASYPGWDVEAFATASGYDEKTGRYLGLVVDDEPVSVSAATLLVQPEIARRQVEPDREAAPSTDAETEMRRDAGPESRVLPTHPVRFHGAVQLQPERMGRDLMAIQQEVLQHLQRADGGRITVTLEISDESTGYDETTIRTVTENARTLRFEQFGFESG